MSVVEPGAKRRVFRGLLHGRGSSPDAWPDPWVGAENIDNGLEADSGADGLGSEFIQSKSEADESRRNVGALFSQLDGPFSCT